MTQSRNVNLIYKRCAVLIELGNTKGQKFLPLPMGELHPHMFLKDEIRTSHDHNNNDIAKLEAAVLTWRHVLQSILSATPQAVIQVGILCKFLP